MPSESFEKRPLDGHRFAPVAIPKRVHAPEAARSVAKRVGGILEASAPERFTVQRQVLAPDDSVTYVRDARNAVVGRFEAVMASQDGTAWARDGKYWVVISRDGGQQTVVDLGDGAEPGLFWDGVAQFRRDGKIGFVADSGDVFADAKFDDARRFDGAYARVKLGGMWGAVDRAGRQAVPCAYVDENAVSVVLDRVVRRAA